MGQHFQDLYSFKDVTNFKKITEYEPLFKHLQRFKIVEHEKSDHLFSELQTLKQNSTHLLH